MLKQVQHDRKEDLIPNPFRNLEFQAFYFCYG